MSAPSSTRELAHPLPIAAALVLVANDHLLKGAGVLPSWLTGKLSDVTGLFLAPLVLVVAVRALVVARGGSLTARQVHRVALVASVATAVTFALLKTHGPVCALYNRWIGPAVLDPTDLVALPACALAWAWSRRRAVDLPSFPPFTAPALSRAACVLSALACVATSKPDDRTLRAPQAPRATGAPCADLSFVGDVTEPDARIVLRAERKPGFRACQLSIRAREFISKGRNGYAYEAGGAVTVTLDDDPQEIVVRVQLPFPTPCDVSRVVYVDEEEREPGAPDVWEHSLAVERHACLPTQEIVAP